jgi:phytoene synthase
MRSLSYNAEQVRRLDTDRFLCTLFAARSRREALFALYAFNLEVARIRELVSEPLLGAMRLQWWRDTIEGIYSGSPEIKEAAAGSEVVAGLTDAVQRFGLTRGHFERLLAARAFDLGDGRLPDLDALLAYAEGTSATLTALALETLWPQEPGAHGRGKLPEAALAAGRDVGIAWALTGLLRAVGFHARSRRLYLPQSLLDEAGVRASDVFGLHQTAGLAKAAEAVADRARAHLAAARQMRRQVPRAAHPALLPAVLADAYLGRLGRVRYDVFDPKLDIAKPIRQLRLVMAAARGRY